MQGINVNVLFLKCEWFMVINYLTTTYMRSHHTNVSNNDLDLRNEQSDQAV